MKLKSQSHFHYAAANFVQLVFKAGKIAA